MARAALAQAGLARPDAVAVTAGPGPVGGVLVAMSYGKALAAGWGVPLIGVNPQEGHLPSPTLADDPPPSPFLALVVSGGHTTRYRCDDVGRYVVLGQTVDDAAGEAL